MIGNDGMTVQIDNCGYVFSPQQHIKSPVMPSFSLYTSLKQRSFDDGWSKSLPSFPSLC